MPTWAPLLRDKTDPRFRRRPSAAACRIRLIETTRLSVTQVCETLNCFAATMGGSWVDAVFCLRLTAPRLSRLRLGAAIGINQILSWGMTFYLPATIAGPAAATLGQLSFRVLGAFSWSLLVAGFCAPTVGRWIDRNGGRGVLLASIMVIALGQALLATSLNLALWYLGWTVIGAGMAMGLYDAAFATVGGLLGREAGPSIPVSPSLPVLPARSSGP